jgi:hypothetical protein
MEPGEPIERSALVVELGEVPVMGRWSDGISPTRRFRVDFWKPLKLAKSPWKILLILSNHYCGARRRRIWRISPVPAIPFDALRP